MGCVAGSRKAGVESQGAQLKRASGTNMSHQASTRERLQNNSRRPRSLPYRRLATLLLLFVLLMTLGTASAQNLHDRRRIRQSSAPLLATVPVQDLASWKDQGSLLVVDTRPPPDAPHLMHLRHRAEDATKTTSAPSSKRSIDTDPSAAPSNFKIPTPFDTALSNNYTTTCALFFQNLLTDSEFNDCHPFSLLLQTSSGFFDASKSYIRITQTLEATCKSNLSTCRNVMNTKARTLISKNHCGVDYENDNPQVLQAYNGLLAYEPLYKASCLQDQQGNFCYANAVTNATSPTDSYPYYLPLGVTLPGGARPTCNSCLQNAMAIFSSFADNSTQPISKTYNSAAQQIDVGCGPTFVNKTAVPLKGAASGTSATLLPSLTLLIIFFYFFQ